MGKKVVLNKIIENRKIKITIMIAMMIFLGMIKTTSAFCFFEIIGTTCEETNTITTFKTEPNILSNNNFVGWSKPRFSGNESTYFNYTLVGNTFCLIPKFTNDLTIEECKCISVDEKQECSESICKNITYSQPLSLKIIEGNKELSPIIKTDDKFCYTLDPFISLYYRFGKETVILEGDTSYNTTDTNITQEAGNAHLEISEEPPYGNLVGYWNFDATKGTTGYDLSSNNADGIVIGNLSFNEDFGFIGGSLLGEGRGLFTDRIGSFTIPSNSNLKFGNDFTYMMWFMANKTESLSYLLSKGGNNQEYNILRTGGGGIRCRQKDGFSGVITVTSTTSITEHKWTHVTCRRNATILAVFFNGVEEAQSGFILGGDESVSSLTIGSLLTSNYIFNGSIDEVMIFNTSLTNQEILDIYNNQSARFKTSGTMNFTEVNVSVEVAGTEDRLNISINLTQAFLQSNITVVVDGGAPINITGGNATDIEFTGDPFRLNISFILNVGNSITNFYTPFIIGNITLDSWTFSVADSCTCVVSGDWNIDCADNCVITSDCIKDSGNVYVSGAGSFRQRAIISGYGEYIISGGCDAKCDGGNTCI